MSSRARSTEENQANQWYQKNRNSQFNIQKYNEIRSFPDFKTGQSHNVVSTLALSAGLVDLFEHPDAESEGTALMRDLFFEPTIAWNTDFILNMTLLFKTRLDMLSFVHEFSNHHLFQHLACACHMYCTIWRSFCWSPPDAAVATMSLERSFRLCRNQFRAYIQDFIRDVDTSFFARELIANQSRAPHSGQVPPAGLHFLFGHFDNFEAYKTKEDMFRLLMNGDEPLPMGDILADQSENEVPWNQRLLQFVYDVVYASQRPHILIKMKKCLAMHAYEQWLRLLNLDSDAKIQVLQLRYRQGVSEMAKMLGVLYAEMVACGIQCIAMAQATGHTDLHPIAHAHVSACFKHVFQHGYIQSYLCREVRKAVLVLDSQTHTWFSRPEYNKRIEAIMMMLARRLMQNSASTRGENLHADIVDEILQKHATGIRYGTPRLES